MMKAKNRQHLVMAVMTAVMMGSTPLTVQAAAPDLRGAQNSVSALQRQAQQEAQGRNSLPSSQPAKAEVQNTLPTQGPGSDQVHFTIRNFRLEAPEFYLDKKDLATILKKSMGHELTLRDLNATVDELTRYARQHGYPAAAAYVPAQESKDGMVLIRMMPGRYGEVKLENHSKLKDSVAQGFLHGLKKGAIVKTSELETTLFAISDTSGTRAVGVLSPGKDFGTSDVTVRIEDGKGTNTVLYVENHGAKSSGRYRLGLQHSIYDVQGTGGKVNTGVTLSDENMHNYYVNYTALVGHGGTTAGVGLSRMDYDLGDTLGPLNAKGIAMTYSLFGSKPIYHQMQKQLQLDFGYDYRNLHDDITAPLFGYANRGRKHTQDIYAGLSGYWRRNGFLTNYDFKVATGRLTMDSDASRAADAREKTSGRYTKLTLDTSNVQRTGHRSDLLLKLSGQWATHNLDGSEELSLGGANGVRAYPQGEGSGDIGWLTTAEWRFYTDVRGLVPSVFYDIGHTKFSKDGQTVAGRSGVTLRGYGLGLAYSDPGNWFARLDYARRIGNSHNPVLSRDAMSNGRFWFLMGKIW